MHGLRIKLVIYTLVLSAAIIIPLILFIFPTYKELAGLYHILQAGENGLSLAEIRTDLQTKSLQPSRLVSVYLSSLLALIVAAAYVVNHLVIKPVQALASATNQLARGNPAAQLPVTQHDEIGNLAKSLQLLHSNVENTMLRQEKESVALNELLFKLQASEQRIKGIFNNVQDGLLVTDELGIIEAVNPALCEMTGYQEYELVGNNVDMLVPQAYKSRHQQRLGDFVQNDKRTKRDYMPLEAQHKDGKKIPIELSLSKLSTNKQCSIIAVLHDISERKQAEAALCLERDRAQCYLDTAEVAIISLDKTGHITLTNRKCRELLGYSDTELLGMDYFSLCADREAAKEARGVYLQHIDNNVLFPKYFYINLRTKDGRIRIFEWYNNTINDSQQNTAGILLAGSDMTELRKSIEQRRLLRDRLLQSQKMQAIGQLSGGIAHDFNNILATMMGYTELLQEMLADHDNESIQNYLREIYISGERARDLIDNMLRYSREIKQDDANPVEALYLPGICDELSDILYRMLPANIELSLNLLQDAHPVMIDSLNLQQIVMNLCLNASEAMPEGGNLIINTSNRKQYHGNCSSCNKPFNGDYFELSFSDTGPGVAEKNTTHLFEPFYTTKAVGEVGKGAGMGLAVVHGLVHDVGGHIIVESKPGVGSIFRILLPAATMEAAPAKHA